MAQASQDPIFAEDNAPDEEPLEWEATDEGIEISLDCTKCAAYTPFTLTWDEILALGAGRKVKNFSRVGSSLHYRHRCDHCLANYRSAEYSDKDAQREATSTLIISLAEFDAWNRQAIGRARAAGRQVPQAPQQQQPVMEQPAPQPQQPVQVSQPEVQPRSPQRPVQSSPATTQPQGASRSPRVRLSPEDKASIRRYVRQLVQQGYSKEQIIEARRDYARELLQTRREEAAIAQAQHQATQQAPAVQRPVRRRAPQQTRSPAPVVQQGAKYRRARTKDGRLVLVDAAGRIVKFLS